VNSGRGSGALLFALTVSGALALAKYAFGLYTGSLLLLASAADSFSDAVVSGVNLWGYTWARTPPDREHPFGHGKLEGVLATGQGALLFGIAASVVAMGIKGLIDGPRPPKAGLAAIVLAVSTAFAAALSFALARAAKAERSAVVEADAAHYRLDLITGGASISSMVIVGATGWAWLDPVASIGAAVWMMREAAGVLRIGLAELLDVALPAEDRAAIDRVLERHRTEVVEFHGVKTRRSGPVGFVEVHAVLRPEMSLAEVHRFVQNLSREIREAVPGSRVMVHPDAAGLRDEMDLALEARPRGEAES
jgi:ferrous-iron efflux pump FieF